MDAMYRALGGAPLWRVRHQLASSHDCVGGLVKAAGGDDGPYLRAVRDSPLVPAAASLLLLETFLGGLDATATTLAMTLHELSLCARAQNAVRAEAAARDGTCTYTRACLRETLRLHATAGAGSRYTSRDCVLHGYVHLQAFWLPIAFSI